MLHATRPRLIAIALGGAILLAACGGDSDDDLGVDPQAAREAEASANADATTEDIEACSLLSEDEASELLGVAVTSVEPTAIRTFAACDWINDATLPIKSLQVGIFDFTASSNLVKETAGALGELDEVSGIGDEAYWNGSQLYVRKGELMMSIFPSGDGGREQAEAAAKLVVPRLD